MEIINICTINFVNNTIRCIPEKGAYQSSLNKQLWESWYIWFGIGLVFFLVLTSIITYVANACKRKQQNIIRIRNFPCNSGSSNVISTINGPGGIIQPDIKRFSNQVGAESPTVIPLEDSGNQDHIKNLAKPLTPPYPPVEQITIVKGSAPPEGYRQTDLYTEIVLPPGFIDSNSYKI